MRDMTAVANILGSFLPGSAPQFMVSTAVSFLALDNLFLQEPGAHVTVSLWKALELCLTQTGYHSHRKTWRR